MKKEIVFFCPAIEDGGVEKNLFLMINEISKKTKTTLITFNNKIRKKLNNQTCLITFKNSKIINFPRFIKSICCMYLGLKFLLLKKNAVLISYESNLFAIILSKFTRVPIIVRSNASPSGYIQNPLKLLIFKFFFKNADVVLVNSLEFKTKIDKILNIKSKILYNSIIGKKKLLELSSKKIKKFIRKKKNLKIIIIGRLVKQKDQITILKALNLIKSKLNFFTLVIGKGELKNNLIKFCIENNIDDKIKFLGYKKNIYPYLKWSNALILSSKYEGSPNVLLEAISMKKTVISSDCPTGPREILQNGKGGYLFKTGDFLDLSKKIKICFFNKRENKKKIKYSQKIIKKFNIEKNKDRLLKIVNSLK